MMHTLATAWRTFWHRHADSIRSSWAEQSAEWEEQTEPGNPLPPFNAAWRDVGLGLADVFDAIGGRR